MTVHLAAVLLYCLLLGTALATPRAFVREGKVTYTGVYQSSVEAFLGIAYGQDSGGENRFKPPKPYVPARGATITAHAAGPACPQATGATGLPLYLSNITHISEDCLHLNITRPNGTKATDRLPVMVYIHGGGFSSSSKDELTTQPSGLILQSIANGHPVMVVGINYRLAAFGFAVSDALINEGSANAGLKDQRLALEWVRDNIGYFGGDPIKVTIFGQSSGGLAVGMQIMAYGASKAAPFQQAICESQALEPGITGNFTKLAMQRLVDAVGCNITSLQSNDTVACLRKLSMEQLLTAQTNTYQGGAADNLGDIWLPAVDGDFLPDAPTTLITQGRFANVTAMIGWCEDDTTPFTDATIETANDTAAFVSAYAPGLTEPNLKTLLSLYPIQEFTADPKGNLSAQFYRSARILRDILMVCQPIHYGQAIAKAGNDLFYYEQNQTIATEVLDSLGSPGLGVVHTSEFAYVFGNLSHYDADGFPYHPNASDFALSDRESRSWSTFASLGFPSLVGHDTLKGWTPSFARPNETDIFVIGGPHEGLSAEDGPRSERAVEAQKLRERCGFINSPDVIKQWNY
ncbi:hypothetical protein LTR85_001051 [Meristemomyces frigidus]|nr:hypothetical protein LTR85_001051 [Meristemomyces frigidus]